MADKAQVIRQTELAFDFVQRLYLEASYLIKEIEGILKEEPERFVIGKAAGYAISARSSTGLESSNVNLWLLRKFGVCFIPEQNTIVKGQTKTAIHKELRVLYLRIVLRDKGINEPRIYSGVLHDIETKPMANKEKVNWIRKFENIMGHIEYNDDKVFKTVDNILYEDAYIKLRGRLVENNLYDINDSEAIVDEVINPALTLFREHTTIA